MTYHVSVRLIVKSTTIKFYQLQKIDATETMGGHGYMGWWGNMVGSLNY